MAAVTKGNIRRFINEKNDCTTNSDFVTAAKSTKYMTLFACRLPSSSGKNKIRWPGIQSFNNIDYELVSQQIGRTSKTNENEVKITVWRAFNIGSGRIFYLSKLKAAKCDIRPIEVSIRHDDYTWQSDNVERSSYI